MEREMQRQGSQMKSSQFILSSRDYSLLASRIGYTKPKWNEACRGVILAEQIYTTYRSNSPAFKGDLWWQTPAPVNICL
jgi:hypothetical protein